MSQSEPQLHPDNKPTVSTLKKPISLDIRKPGTLLLLAWIIFAGALGLRITGLGEYPARHATDDEFHYLWSGLNFWDSGQPASWSGLQGSADLKIGDVHFDGNDYGIVSPAFDHPPLFSLLAGAFARLTNPSRLDTKAPEGTTITVWDVDLHRARWLMVLLFAGTFWFLFGLARSAFPPGVALLTILFYGFMSHAVAHGRLIVSDNLSTLFLVANAWAIQRWLAGRMSQYQMAVWTIALTALAVITKIPAWCQVPALITVFFMARRPRQCRYVLYGFGIGILLYLAWITWYGLPDFIAVMKSQSNRFRGFNAFQLISGIPRILEMPDLNGVIIAGWFCLIAQLLRPRTSPLMVIAPVYMLAFTFFAGDFLFGWYSAPLYPWLSLALAVTTAQVFRRPRSPMMVAWLLLFLPHAFQTMYIARYDLETVLRYAYVATVAALLVTFGFHSTRSRSILRIAIIAILAVVLMREVYEIVYQRTDRLTDKEKYLNS
jgi:hypothetical protein